jgi:hypothetical protein
VKIYAALIVFLLVVGCNGCQHPQPGPVTPSADAALWDGSTPATCLDLCRHGQDLGCTWAQPTPKGAPCVDVCVNNQAVQIAAWDLDCRVRKSSCAEVDRCR